MTATDVTRRRNGHRAQPAEQVKRAAIYTRKSVEKRLDQGYGSIDAQRDMAEEYLGKRFGEGVHVLPTRYDDGGYSGATVARPALQRLLADVADGQIDVVCIYKLDRLTRNLLDQLQLVAALEKYGVELISISEDFGDDDDISEFLRTIMGSVAQLERKRIAGRVRDKIRQSRRKGIWTGGRPPLGLDSVKGELVVNEAEADQVRDIFAAYLRTGSLTATLDELRRRGITNKSWTNRRDLPAGGGTFTKDSLRKLLASPLYVGDIRAGDQVVEARHEAVIDRETWDAVQAARQAPEPRARRRPRPSKALLAGLVVCARCGSAMVHHFTGKNGKRFNYYVCDRQLREGAAACPGSRASAGRMETLVMNHVRALGSNPAVLDAAVAEARAQVEERRQQIATDERRLRTEKRRMNAEHDKLAATDARGDATAQVRERLEQAETRLAKIAEQATSLRAERAALKGAAIDPDELRAAIASFDAVWQELFPDERQRILNLLIKQIRYDGRTDEGSIEFDPAGARLLAIEGGNATP